MSAEPATLLLIDDKADDQDLIARMLSAQDQAPFRLETASSLAAAQDRLKKGGVDVVLLDVDIPDSRGVDMFLAIGSDASLLPIVLLTSSVRESVAMKAIREGAHDYLVKEEISPSLLRRSIRYAVERNATRLTRQEALTRLEELNETKSQFVAQASHELRTPLAIIREFVALVHDGVQGPLNDGQKASLQAALRNCDRLTLLIDSILDLSRIEAGKNEISRAHVNLAPLLTQCHTDFLPQCKPRNQTLTLDLPPGLPGAFCDAGTIHNILVNLLGNAQKFTPDGGAITLACRHEGRFLRVSIQDTGPGIAPEYQEKIFEAFAQIDRQNGPGAKGTGLGLTITKHLVELNGGTIALDSAPGQGSSFSFTLPVYEMEAPHRILVVDDDVLIINLVRRVLTKSHLNLEVRTTESGLEALIMAGDFRPNLVLLDIHMSEVQGKRVLASLKNLMPGHPCKVLMMSGDAESLEDSGKQGADDFLLKPFSAKELIQKTVTLLGIERRSR